MQAIMVGKTKAPAPPVTPEERSAQVKKVIALMEDETSENKACAIVGINRGTFRSAALRDEVADDYARALKALAQDQIEKLEVVLDDLRAKKIDPQTARVLSDNRRWFASKFLPRSYGDKLDIDSKQEVTHKYEDMNDEQLEAILQSRKDTIS